MMAFAEHLDYLTSSSPEVVSCDIKWSSFDDWFRINACINDVFPPEQRLVEDSWDSVLDVFSAPQSSQAQNIHAATRRVLSKLGFERIAELAELLSCSRSGDEISAGVVELVGLDEIELGMELIQSRDLFSQQLTEYLHSESTARSSNIPQQSSSSDFPSLAPEDVRRRREEALKANAARPLFTGTSEDLPENLPNVFTTRTNTGGGNFLSQFGTKYARLAGSTRHDYEDYIEEVMPPAKAIPPRNSERLVPISELDDLVKGSFPNYATLNRVQSIVYPTAYKSNENILVCAPTGAGKTDIAMLAILRVLEQHRRHLAPGSPLATTIDRDSFKVIYVAPMKALASEITQKLRKRLKWLSVNVRELTGDMQLTRTEMAETQILVTTPEKWDVVTRKPIGEGEQGSKVKLLVIDEVHLLNDDRGAVIETIVARTLRQAESSQSMIRIVGLSATLPNYIDVADFLSVSRLTGLFYFDSSFRPIPLEQHFIGVRGKPGSVQSKRNLDRVTFEKVSQLVKQGHQLMVFVHARKETVNTALALKDAAMAEGALSDYSCEDNPQWSLFRRSIGESRNRELKQLFDYGFGIHHAGMVRSDRHLVETVFQAKAIKVLCCTATLAWGVNLPAHAVIIKGTTIYDSAKGANVDLSVLDVLQVFGRAGRPGLELSGEGYICTTEDKLQHYIDAVTSQIAIESKFQSGIIDALNAEIALGTVTTIDDGVRWLGYTYLLVRMRKNPHQYGVSRETLINDPQLVEKRQSLIQNAAKQLVQQNMINFNEADGTFMINDIGRIAAKYYVRHQSIATWQSIFRAKMSESEVLRMLSKSTEFDQILFRESEAKELDRLERQTEYNVDGGTDTSQGKVNVLLQAHISGLSIEDFALVSDTAYIAQNSGRLVRALLEMAISRRWAGTTTVLAGMSKAVEACMWPFDEPMKQFPLKSDVIYGLVRSGLRYSPNELASMTAAELGELIKLNERHGEALLTAAKQFPSTQISVALRPLGPEILKISVVITRTFVWNSKIHGSTEPFWLWVEDHDGESILQIKRIALRESTKNLGFDFVISLTDKMLSSVTIRVVSDRWFDADNEHHVPLDTLIMPTSSHPHTRRQDVDFLPLSSLRLPRLGDLYSSSRFSSLNAIQTQIYWSLISTRANVLVVAPVGSGKSFLANMTIWFARFSSYNWIINEEFPRSSFRSQSFGWTLIVAPNKNVVANAVSELRPVSAAYGIDVEQPNMRTIFAPPKSRVIRVATASILLDAIRVVHPGGKISHPSLVLCENLEQLDDTYELAVSLLRHATQYSLSRYIGLSRSLNDPSDLASWLDVKSAHLHSFLPRDREQPLNSSVQTYTTSLSEGFFRMLAKPTYAAMNLRTTDEPAVVIVPSRGHCQTVAQELITQHSLNFVTETGFISKSASGISVEDRLVQLQNPMLANFASRGVGILHQQTSKATRQLILELYAEGMIRVLIIPREACWTLPVKAGTVVVLATQYVYVDPSTSERQLKDYTLQEVVEMQGLAVRHFSPGYFVLFCPTEDGERFNEFLNGGGLPLESQLLETDLLSRWYREQVESGTLRNKQDGVEALSFTFLARRAVSNPVYYDLSRGSLDETPSRIVDRIGSN